MTASKNSSSFAKQAKLTKKKSIKKRIRRRPNRYTKHLRTKNRVPPRHYTHFVLFFFLTRIPESTTVQNSKPAGSSKIKIKTIFLWLQWNLTKSKHEHTGAALK
jgi:hypothetical protein